jgi:hypothetical protein
MFEALYKLILKGIKLAHIPENNIFETRKGCSYSTPSMGAIGLTYFKRLKPELCNNDVYGFSYKDMISPGAENYQNIIIEHDSLNIVHDMKRESAYLRELMDYKGKCEVNV